MVRVHVANIQVLFYLICTGTSAQIFPSKNTRNILGQSQPCPCVWVSMHINFSSIFWTLSMGILLKMMIVELFWSRSEQSPKSKSVLMYDGKEPPEAQEPCRQSYHMHVINGSSFLLKAGVLFPTIPWLFKKLAFPRGNLLPPCLEVFYF